MTRPMPKHPLNEQAREEAANWLVAFSEGEVGASEKEAFLHWLRASPEHVRAYLRVASLWSDDDLFTRARKLDADELVKRALEESNVVTLAAVETSSDTKHESASRGRPIPWR